MRLLPAAVLAIWLALATTATAERLFSTVSDPDVQITSSFEGATLTLFGNIEPSAGEALRGPYQVIIVVEGPLGDRVARHKTNVFGVWLNTEQVVFDSFPTFYHVLASDKLANITDIVTLTAERITPDTRAWAAAQSGWWPSTIFSRQLVRLMTEEGFFRVNEHGVQFFSQTAYSARVNLPATLTSGRYIAHTYVFRRGEIVARTSEGFLVRKTGFERFLAIAAIQQPLLYGIACVFLALGTGWLGGWIFKR